jgi:hypothetical protein
MGSSKPAAPTRLKKRDCRRVPTPLQVCSRAADSGAGSGELGAGGGGVRGGWEGSPRLPGGYSRRRATDKVGSSLGRGGVWGRGGGGGEIDRENTWGRFGPGGEAAG